MILAIAIVEQKVPEVVSSSLLLVYGLYLGLVYSFVCMYYICTAYIYSMLYVLAPMAAGIHDVHIVVSVIWLYICMLMILVSDIVGCWCKSSLAICT